MATSSKIEDIDLGWRATKRNLAGLDGMRVSAGLFDEREALKGAFNELGTSRIPSRPWLSVAADTNAGEIGEMAKQAAGAVADRDATARQALTPLGRFMRDAAKAVIGTSAVGGPDLAPSTVARKGHSAKLLDSGDMRDAITFEIDKDGLDL